MEISKDYIYQSTELTFSIYKFRCFGKLEIEHWKLNLLALTEARMLYENENHKTEDNAAFEQKFFKISNYQELALRILLLQQRFSFRSSP